MGYKTDVHPQRISTIVVLCLSNISLTFCVRWAENLSRNSKAGLLSLYTIHLLSISNILFIDSGFFLVWHNNASSCMYSLNTSLSFPFIYDHWWKHFACTIARQNSCNKSFFWFCCVQFDGVLPLCVNSFRWNCIKNTGVSSLLTVISYWKSTLYCTKIHILPNLTTFSSKSVSKSGTIDVLLSIQDYAFLWNF